MERPFWRNEEIVAELEGLNVTDVIDFGINQLLADPHTAPSTATGSTLLCFAHGNVDDNQVQYYFSCIASIELTWHLSYS